MACIPCIKGQINHAGHMPIHCHLPMLYTVVGTPDTATGSTSSSAGATVPPVQSSFQQPTGMLSNVKLNLGGSVCVVVSVGRAGGLPGANNPLPGSQLCKSL